MLVIVVNYRTAPLTVQCLEALARERDACPSMHVVVVENGSGDSSAVDIGEAIARAGWGEWCHLVRSDRNLGFAGGNNAGLRWAEENLRERWRMVLLLNSDTVVHRGCLAYCAGVLDKDGTIGALSCRLLNADGSLQVAARRFQSPLRLLVGATGLPWALPRIFGWAQIEYRGWDMERDAGDPDWIGGAFMMIPRSVVDEIGLFDESFFFYGEDQEYCHRVWASGRRVHYDPHATTTHLGGSSSDPSRMKSEARSRAVWRARYLFLCRRYGVLPMLAVRFADIGMLAGRTIVSHLTGGRESGRKVELRTAWQCVVSKLGPM